MFDCMLYHYQKVHKGLHISRGKKITSFFHDKMMMMMMMMMTTTTTTTTMMMIIIMLIVTGLRFRVFCFSLTLVKK